VSGKLRLEGDVATDVTVYAQWAQAFRAPTANELYLDYGGPGTYLRVGNPNLKPETSNGFDVGALIGDKDFGGSVSTFYNRYKNFIDDLVRPGFNPEYPMGITDTINRANVEIYGFEFTAHARDESGWHGWGKFGIYEGRDIDEDISLNTIPAAKLILGVGYAADFWGADAIFTAAAGRDFPDDVENERSETPSYQTLDFTAWVAPPQVEGLTIRAGIYNIFDEEYYEDALDLATSVQNKEYYTQAGRNVRVSASYKF
jgi:hemoglobin/transferrin/lactoferrin receptor protein